jgi:hypothetical protein
MGRILLVLQDPSESPPGPLHLVRQAQAMRTALGKFGG